MEPRRHTFQTGVFTDKILQPTLDRGLCCGLVPDEENLQDRKEDIIRLIDEKGMLTDELVKQKNLKKSAGRLLALMHLKKQKAFRNSSLSLS